MIYVIISILITASICLFVPYWGPILVPRAAEVSRAAEKIGREKVWLQGKEISEAVQKSRLGEKVVIHYDLSRRFDRVWNETQRQSVNLILMIVFISGTAIFILQGLDPQGVDGASKAVGEQISGNKFIKGIYAAVGIGELVGVYMLYQKIAWVRNDIEPYLGDIEAHCH